MDTIIISVASALGIAPEEVISKSRVPPRPYCRELAAYFFRTMKPEKRCRQIAAELNLAPAHNYISYCAAKIYSYQKTDEKVRKDVKRIEEILKQAEELADRRVK